MKDKTDQEERRERVKKKSVSVFGSGVRCKGRGGVDKI